MPSGRGPGRCGNALFNDSRSTKLLLAKVVGLVLFAFSMLFTVNTATAQSQDLFLPLQTATLRETPPSQELVDKLTSRPTTESLVLVRVDLNALRGNEIRLSAPNMNALTITKQSEESRSPQDFTWYGVLQGVPGQATLVVRNGNITGSVRDQGTLYRIEPVGNGVHAVIKVDERRFPPDDPPSFEEKEHRGDIQAPSGTEDANNRGDAGPVGIDVMVAYTTGAKNAVADIIATIQLAVAEANQSYVNSKINIRLRLVDTFEVAYSESGKTFDTILADFVANPTVQNRRDASGADLSAMIINQSDYCGLADDIMAKASTAFAVVYYDCATGYYSFAHELGHLQGARHDPANDNSTTPFAYGHGYQYLTAPAWRTVMAYNCSGGCPRLQYWSSPNVKYNGIAMGTAATNDNARVLNGTATTVAAFRSASKALSEHNIDRPGADYKNFDLGAADPNLCLNSCAGEAQCKAWTYVNPGVQGPNARCWLKVSVPAANPSTCCDSGVKAVEYSVDRPGADYKNFDLARADPNLCLNSCANEAQCKAWTYVNPGVQGASARCWLKTGVPAANPSTCCDSGVRAVEFSLDRPGADYKNFDLARSDPNLCMNSCAAEAQCKAWTYVNPGVQGPSARCWLKTSVPAANPSTCCDSGVRAVEYAIDRPGADYKNFDLAKPDPNLCLSSCAGEAQCKAWTYVNPGVQGPNPRCWLKTSAPSANPSTCCDSGVKAMEYSIDRPGSDYKNFDLAKSDPNLCLSSCANDAQCKAWTFVNAGIQGPNPRCWLKTGSPPPTPNACCVSGLR